jgi:Flp pilus assembly protein TadG
MKLLSRLRQKFISDQRGAVAIITAIVMLPILFYCVGVPIDLARAIQLRSALQNITDTAALAGSAELAQGGTASQACSIANQFVTAEAGQLSVSYAALTPNGNFASTNGENDTLTTTSTNGTVTQSTSSSTTSTGCTNAQPVVVTNSTSSGSTTTTTASFTSPYQVVVGISTKIPTTFMSFAKANIPVSVAGTASGPTGFVKICMQNGGSISDDLSSFYYYYIDPSGNLDIDPAGDPLDKSNPLPGLANNKLTDNVQNPNSYNKIVVPPTNPLGGEPADFVSTGCNSAATAAGILSYLVVVHLPPGWRLGYYYQNITGGKDVCYYAEGQPYTADGRNVTGKKTTDTYAWTFNDNDVSCLGTAADASGTNSSNNSVAAYGSGITWNGKNNLVPFYTTAYGGTPLTINRFYTTDYPASLKSSTYSSTPISSSNGGTVGDFSANGQSAAIRHTIPGSPPNSVYFNSNANFYQNGLPTQTSGDNVIGQTSGDLVCLVNANTHTQDITVITSYNSTGNYTTASGVFNDQQQNVVLQNSSQSSLYKCPTNVSGDPYNLNPSCSDLNGATITGGWNDMGGYPADSVGYQDLTFSISCSAGTGVPQLDYDNVALTQ